MYVVKKRMEISAAHSLELDYESACQNPHGHNWIITVYCVAEDNELNKNGMVIDFTHIKEKIHKKLDHKVINTVIPHINPTAENMAKWIYDQLDNCYRVDVQESEGNSAVYLNESIVLPDITTI